jgi:apolipoprotein N-acyltransferase
VVWPETVITTFLNGAPQLQARFAALARSLDTTLIVGSDERSARGIYNALYFFSPERPLPDVYEKRRLVPFAEYLPGRALLGALPYADLISDFAVGTENAVFTAGGMQTAPLVCWESGFAGLAQTQIRAGAQLLVISTDDAWFGRTGGPYQHAQLAQLRAVETGRWVVRAASTGISGIIAPDGRYITRSGIDTEAVIAGAVGLPQPTVFSRIGPHAIALAMLVVLVALVLPVTRLR